MSGKLFDRANDLVSRIAELKAVPRRSTDERAVYDAWRIAVKPRATRMLGRVRRIADPRQWEFDEERRPELLRPGAWSLAVREMASLYVELSGALEQHERMRIVWSPRTRFGIHRGPKTPIPTAKMKPKERAAARQALDQARKARMKSAQKVMDGIVKRLEETRKALREAIAEVRHVTAALQRAEEDRLARRVARLQEGARERQRAEDLLVELARGRLGAERIAGEKASRYGSRLRQEWLIERAKLIGLVEGP